MDAITLLESAVNGALVGLMYSMVAMGIVLIYKSSSVPNLRCLVNCWYSRRVEES